MIEDTAEGLGDLLGVSRARTMELAHDLEPAQLMGPKLETVNPFLWEIGHVAWFHELFTLRHLDGTDPILPQTEELYNSMYVPHGVRWDLPLPSFDDTLGYLEAVTDAMKERLAGRDPSPEEAHLYRLTAFHEDMHTEAFLWARQIHGWRTPTFAGAGRPEDADAGPLAGDVAVPGGHYRMGQLDAARFAFDNERQPLEVEVAPFRIAKAPVTNAEFRAFIDDGGYRDDRLWSAAGLEWKHRTGAAHPLYWKPDGAGGFTIRCFDEDEPLQPHRPVIHVNWYEAEAWCNWAGRRLPTEAEWEFAAGVNATGSKREYPWGSAPPDRRRANLDGYALGTIDVGALPGGDSPWGCRQMLGNVWEWVADSFGPYPGFTPMAYREYSEPWFKDGRKVLRGGAWMTRSHMINVPHRNFAPPGRRTVFAGFRTCAL